jgi:hypothetical protein
MKIGWHPVSTLRASTLRAGRARHARTAAGVLLAGALAACSTATSTGPVSIAPSYDRAYIADVAERGGMPLVLRGDPFPGNNGPFAEQVATALTDAHFGPAFTVFADPAEAPDGSAKTVLVVNPKRPVNSGNVCRTGTTGTPGDGPDGGPDGDSDGSSQGSAAGSAGTLEFTIAFCSANRRLSSMRGRLADVSGPEDPRIGELFRQVAIQLYPPRNPDRNDQDLMIN